VNFLQKILGQIRRDEFSDSHLLNLTLPNGQLVRDVVEEIKKRTDLSKKERHMRINTLFEVVRLRERQREAAIGGDLDSSEEFWGWSTR